MFRNSIVLPTVRAEQDDVHAILEETEAEKFLDRVAIDALGPAPTLPGRRSLPGLTALYQQLGIGADGAPSRGDAPLAWVRDAIMARAPRTFPLSRTR